jgi:potassium-dependent mechanosensitive channel
MIFTGRLLMVALSRQLLGPLLLAVMTTLLLTAAAAAQVPVDTMAVRAPEALPASFEVVTRARVVIDSAAQVERTIERLAVTAPIEAELAVSALRVEELETLLVTLGDADFVRPERVSRLGDRIMLEDQRLEALLERAVTRLTQLGEIRGEWLERRRFWERWRMALRDDADFELLEPDITRSLERIGDVLDGLADVLPHVVTLQREIEGLRASVGRSAATVEAQRAGRRQALLRRGEPVLLSAGHRAQLTAETLRAWKPLDIVRPRAYLAFLRDAAGVLALYALLALFVGAMARRLHRRASPDAGWAGLLAHPWAIGLLIASILAMQRVVLAPPLWDVALWTIFAAAAARLVVPLLAHRALRRTVYLFAVVYPLFMLMDAAALPAPLFRIGLALVAAATLPAFLYFAQRGTIAVTWPLRVGAMMWVVVLVAVTLGYDLLGRWVLHATVTSGAVVFTLLLLLAIARGAVITLLGVQSEGRFRFLRVIGVPLAQRIVVLLQFVLVVIAALVLLDVWELAASPIVTWRMIVNAGFDAGPVRITVGRILFGMFVVYLAVLISWLVRTMVQSEVYRRWDFDRGVGTSINMLVHYTLITLGVIIALGVLGVELQNFAIIVGALGIGIGFGLQNVVNNFVSGLILLFERPVRVGDTVVVAGEWGTIQKIGLRSTIMLTFDQSEMIVPNADLVSEKVTNWTLTSQIARVILPVGVAYGSDINQVLDILRNAGAAHDSVLTDPAPMALFIGFGDSSLDFELRVWVREIRLRLEVRSIVLTEVERAFREAGIEIPFPQTDLHVRSIDADAAKALTRGPL